MVTTIQLRESVKSQLERFKESRQETYEETILKLMKIAELQKRKQEELLIEGCKVMAEDMLSLNKELEGADSNLDWEWK